ncbi:MAG: SRPBCC domain-containing protein [Actinobacteria bacterium]|nr:SRPBCC domain-containing protein [Actinomycetota bacterium]
MSVTRLEKDRAALTMTVVAEFETSVQRAWRLWADPRQLERWWGPPTYPATFVEHDLTPGGSMRYYMTGPEGEKHGGWWRVLAVEPPHRIEVEDGFADGEGNPNPGMPTTTFTVTLEELAGPRTRITIVSRFPSAEAMDQLTDMGMDEGITAAVGQIDDILGEDAA